MTTIAELTIADDPALWRSAGFTVDEDGVCQIGMVRLRIGPPVDDRTGLIGWALAGTPHDQLTDVDGLASGLGDPPPAPLAPDAHPIGARNVDHVVVLTSDVARTVAAVEQGLGLALKRTRDGDASGRPVRQAFFRLGEVILEVVGSPEPDPRGGPARFFGLAITVESIDAAAAWLGPDLVGPPKPAVQPGRSIATIRSAAGLAVPVALMSASS